MVKIITLTILCIIIEGPSAINSSNCMLKDPFKGLECYEYDWIRFQTLFYFAYDFIYIGELFPSDWQPKWYMANIKIAGCSCKETTCTVRCCTFKKTIRFSKCSDGELPTKYLNILGKDVNIFEYPFRLMNETETWRLCDERNQFMAMRNKSVRSV